MWNRFWKSQMMLIEFEWIRRGIVGSLILNKEQTQGRHIKMNSVKGGPRHCYRMEG
jgi:hypothetical protein